MAATLAGTATAPAAAQPVYQQYLIPTVAADVPGAFGSIWRSDLALFNAGLRQHFVVGPFCNPAASVCAPAAPLVLPASAGVLPALFAQSATDGAFLYISTPAADVLSEFRIRDLSRQSQTWGTELPIVPTTSFRQSINLLDIPTDSRFRRTLRIYSTGVSVARVQTIAFPGQTELSVQDVPLAAPPTLTQQLNLSPSFVQLSLPPITGSDSVRIQIDQVLPGGSPIWAFVSITNNDTQQVTAITPHMDTGSNALGSGLWAGEGMCFEVDSLAAKVVYACSTGNFAPPIVTSDNRFDADGTWRTSIGPMVTIDPAHLSGVVQGSSLTLTIRTSIGATIGPVTVQFGAQGPCGATCP